MSLLRFRRGLSIVAILAALLMALLPISFASTAVTQNEAVASEMSDCGMCPKTGMVMVNCVQAFCGLVATEATGLTGAAASPVRYALTRIAIPLGRHTAPPVSPG